MAQQGIEFELVTSGLQLKVLSALVDRVSVLDHYLLTEVSRASSRHAIFAAIHELAEAGTLSTRLANRFNRLNGMIYELRPPCSHVLLCWHDDATRDVLIVHLVPRPPYKPVGNDAIALAERRANAYLQRNR